MENQQKNRPTNGMAISSFVTGAITLLTSVLPIMNFFALLLGAFGIFFGYFALRQIKASQGAMKGTWQAWAGLATNAVGTAFAVYMLWLFLAVS